MDLASLVAVKLALLLAVDQALLGGSWQGWNNHPHLSDKLALLGASR